MVSDKKKCSDKTQTVNIKQIMCLKYWVGAKVIILNEKQNKTKTRGEKNIFNNRNKVKTML